MLQIPGLFIAESENKGRGVFTSIDIQGGAIIEICPLIIVPLKDVANIHQTILHDYYFLWPEPKGAACIALGFGSIYNHSYENNAEVFMDIEGKEIEIRSCKMLKAGSEIFIDYTDGKKDKIWFDVK